MSAVGTAESALPRGSALRDRPAGAADGRGRIAVVGATGAVGREALSILAARGASAERVRALASARSAGDLVPFGPGALEVEEATEGSFEGVDVAIFCASADVSRRLAPAAIGAGAVVIDNSSAFRLREDVPLVIPEVNWEALAARPGARLIANPNCSTIILLVALTPLRKRFGVERVTVCTYQAVSGAGARAIDELRAQTADALAGRAAQPRVFAEPCAFNVFSHNSAVDGVTGLNGEERKIIDETRKIWGDPDVRVSPLCFRVPTERAHLEAIHVTLARAAREDEVREALETAPGVAMVDDREGNSFPTPVKAAGRDEVLVGRIHPDPGAEVDAQGRSREWRLVACGDQLRKGAALNAVQVAKRVRAESSKEPPSLKTQG